MTGLPTSRNYYRRPLSPWPRRMAVVALVGIAFVVVMFLTGCATFGKRGRIKTDVATVQGVANAGTPAVLETANAGTTVPLPAGSSIVVTKEAAVPARPATATETAMAAMPAKETTVITPAGPTEYRHTEATVRADTGTVDTSVAKHGQDVAERRWLLWVAIACGVGGLIVRSMLPAWPALSNGLLMASVAAGVAWKLADVPSWIWFCVLAVAALMVAGYKRAEWDKDGDNIPDIFQHRKPPTP